MRYRARRAGLTRWLLRGLAGIVGLVVLAAGVGLLALQTDPGRRLVEHQVEHALDRLLRGHVDIGRLEGNLVRRVIAIDVVLRDAAGREALRIRRLEASYSLLALLGHVVRVRDVKVFDPVITARLDQDGKVDLAGILPPPREKTASDRPSPWRVFVRDAALSGGSFSAGGVHVDRLALALSVVQRGTRLRVRLDRATGRWAEKDLTVEGRATFAKNGDAVEVADLLIQAGESRVRIPRASVRTDGHQLEAEVAIRVRRADVLRVVSAFPLQDDLSAKGTVSRAEPGQPFQTRLQGSLGAAPWALDARIGAAPLALAGSLQISGIDPARVWAAAPAGKLEVAAKVDLGGRSLRALRGTARVVVSGHLGGNRLGEVVADLTASGRFDELRVVGRVRAAAVHYRDLRAATVVVDADVEGLPGAPVGRARLEATGVTRGTTALGGVHAEADFRDLGRHIDLSLRAGAPELPYAVAARTQIDRSAGGRTNIRIGELSVRTRQLTWEGHAGIITLQADGGVIMRDVALASSAGWIRGSGQLRVDGDRLDVEVGDLRLEQLLRAMAFPAPGLRGMVNGRLSLLQRKHRARAVEAHLDVRDLVLRPGTNPISLAVEASLHGRDLQGTVFADGGRAGTVALEIEARGPADPLDLEAWQRFDARDLRMVHAELARVELERVFDALGRQPGPLGTVDAIIDVGPRFETLRGHFAIAGMVTPYLDRPLSATADLELAGGKLRIDGRARREGGGEAALTALITAPRPLHGVEAWRRLEIGDVELARLTFDALGLAWFPPIRRRYPDVEGSLAGSITADARGDAGVTVDLRFDRIRSAPLRTPLSARLRTSLFPARSSIELESRLADRSLATVRGTVAAGLDALRARRPGAFLTAAASGKVLVQEFPLALLGTAIGAPVPAAGALDVRAALSGSLERPVIEADASLEGGHIGNFGFGKVQARGYLDQQRLAASFGAAQDGGGSLETKLDVRLGDAGARRLTVKATRFDLGFLAGFATERGLRVNKGILDADLSIGGTVARHDARGSIGLTGGDFRVAEALGTFHQANLSMILGPGNTVAVQLDSQVGSNGRVKLAGTANLIGLGLGDVRGTFETQKLSVSTGGTRASVDARGSFVGVPRSDLYFLTTTLDQGSVSLSSLVGGALHPTRIPEDVVFVDARGRREEAVTNAGSPFLRVQLRTRKPVLVTSEELRAEVDLALDVMVSPAGSALRGRVRIERGFATLSGRRWAFEPSTARFGGESPPDPQLDIKLGYEFRATTVAIVIRGRLSKPELQMLASSGNYDQAQLLGFVLGGNPDDTGPAGQREVSEQTLDAATGLLFAQLQPLLRKVVPIDVLSLQTRTGGREETVFSVGKWFLSNLFVSYRGRFSSQTDERQNANEGKLEWYFARRFRLDLLFGDRGEGSADVLWIRRW